MMYITFDKMAKFFEGFCIADKFFIKSCMNKNIQKGKNIADKHDLYNI